MRRVSVGRTSGFLAAITPRITLSGVAFSLLRESVSPLY